MKCLQTSYLLTALSTLAVVQWNQMTDWRTGNGRTLTTFQGSSRWVTLIRVGWSVFFPGAVREDRKKERVSRKIVSRKIEDWGIEKKNSIKWPKRVINSLVTSRTTFAASERGIQRKLKQKWLGKGGGRDHQSSALMILWAAAERGFLLSGRRRGRTSKSNR